MSKMLVSSVVRPGKLANDSRLLSSCSAVSLVDDGSEGRGMGRGRLGEGMGGISGCCGSCTFVQFSGSVSGGILFTLFSCVSCVSWECEDRIGEETCVCVVVIGSSGATDDLLRLDRTMFLRAGRNVLDI